MSTGNFSTLSVGNDINFFNADGSYILRGPGTVGILNSIQINSRKFVVGADTNLGIMEGGIGYLQGLNISEPFGYLGVSNTNGNLTFTGNYLKQGIIFADNSFLNSANKFNNITTSKIDSNKGTFNELNIRGNLNNTADTILNNLSCDGSANFRHINAQNITGNNAVFSSLNINGTDIFTIPSANISSIYGSTISYNNAILSDISTNNIKIKNATIDSYANVSTIVGNNINFTNSTFTNTTIDNINTTTLKFNNGSIQTTAPGTIINAIVSYKWDVGKTINSPLSLPKGTWLVNFNIFIIDKYNNVIGESYIKSTANNSYFPICTLGNSTTTKIDGIIYNTAVCSGTFVYKSFETETIDLVSNKLLVVDAYNSYHNALQIA